MSSLRGIKVLLGVSGGIAAYKSAALIRHLRGQGCVVRVVMTAAAREFITPLTLEVLSEHPVTTELFQPGFESEIGHIELARWPDVVLVAPATANVIAKARAGIADDMLTTILLATTARVLWCPAMNTQMLGHPATVENVEALRQRRLNHVLDPDAGELACHEVGAGRLPDPPVIEAALRRVLTPQLLAGRRVLITAGPTREYFDPVRFLSNPSTGRMGYALAEACAAAGATVTLVSGPTTLPAPWNVRVVRVGSARQMRDAVFAEPCDIAVMAAAVADWRPSEQLPHKRKKATAPWIPTFERTDDILAQLSESPQRPALLVGFAAETEHVIDNARIKLERKGIDGIVANDVGGSNGAFGNPNNTVTLIDAHGGSRVLPEAGKRDIADEICRWIATLERKPGAAS